MMRVIFPYLFILWSVTALAQDHYLDHIPDKISESPPGTIKINDSTYMDKSPITIHMYLEFLKNIKNGWTREVIKMSDSLSITDLKKVPTDSIESKRFFSLALPENWTPVDSYWNSRYEIESFYIASHYQPIEITTLQARLFCEWRTNILFLIQKNDPEYAAIDYKKYIYTLSTTSELELAQDFFKEEKKLVIWDLKPSKYKREKLNKIWSRNKFNIFTDSNLTELSRNSKIDDTGIFRCSCTVRD